MICIIDYDVGNLFSLISSFNYIGVKAIVSRKHEDIKNADKLILPGVGAFQIAREKLKLSGVEDVLSEQVKFGKPLLGICLGMQMLFTKSFENGEFDGLNYIEGEILPLRNKIPASFKVPHIGWNSLKKNNPDCELLKNISDGSYVYFVHSYYADCKREYVSAYAEYSISVPAVVRKHNVMGCQFHPEKSSNVGLEILKSFSKM